MLPATVLFGGVAAAVGGHGHGPPPLVVQYRDALRAWFPAAVAASLDVVDLTGAERARPERLAFLAVDHAVRHLSPMALDASGKTPQSARLRRLGPITDTAGALAARSSLALTIDAVGRSSVLGPPPRRVVAALAALQAAERSVVHATRLDDTCSPPRPRVRRGARSSSSEACAAGAWNAMREASLVTFSALNAGVEMPVLVEACRQNLLDMARPPVTQQR